ncbi:MAG: adenylosuccinate lyase [Bacteroidetes bacterium]|nr:MAG: adenylosuccinate lyase [Bacteroidota bacterium]
MVLSSLNAISPIDGRYRSQNENLSTYFSEKGLIRYRIRVEVEYFIALCEYPLPQLESVPKTKFDSLRRIYLQFSEEDAERIKEIEKLINHDVKAVEYFLKERFNSLGLSDYKEFIHFGLTSQDINNTAIPLSLKEGFQNVVLPELKLLVLEIKQRAKSWKKISMLARTHGQPASPTRLGKEIYVFVERLEAQLKMLDRIPFAAKFGGATGNFNAHIVAFPNINWRDFGNRFVKEKLGLYRLQTTTQIEHYDYMAAFFDNIKRINSILIDLNRDVWTYISMEYFKQRIKKGEVGSSAMPHKVNPIDFENSEGNLGMANAIFEHLSAKLPISRLQRDLTDSTVTRNLGVPLAHSLLAYKSLRKGVGKLILNEAKIAEDLENNWAVVAEAIQTILRRENYPNPYEALKALTRVSTKMNKKVIHEFIDKLDISEAVKKELKAITPSNYTGITSF